MDYALIEGDEHDHGSSRSYGHMHGDLHGSPRSDLSAAEWCELLEGSEGQHAVLSGLRRHLYRVEYGDHSDHHPLPPMTVQPTA